MHRSLTISLIVALVCAAVLVTAAEGFPAGPAGPVSGLSGPGTNRIVSAASPSGVAGQWSVSMAPRALTAPTVIATILVGAGPFGVEYDAGSGYMFVANEGSNTVSVIDGATVVATIAVGSQPRDVAYNPANGYVYVANFGSNSVSVIDGTKVVTNVSVGSQPEGVVYNGGNGYVYVANRASNTVSVIDGTAVVATVPVGLNPECVAYDSGNGYVFVTAQGSNAVNVIDGTTVVANVSVGMHPEDVGYNSGNGYVYVANYYSNTVSVIDGTTVVANVSVGTHPEGVGYDSGDGYILVSNWDSNDVSVLQGTTVVANVSVGTHPEGIGYNLENGYVYVANFGSNSVSVISMTATSWQYLVTFSETGLPSGTSWSVTLAGSTRSSTTSTIGFRETNGTYAYTVGAVSGYTADPASGNVMVSGADVTQAVAFTTRAATAYAVTFAESGLPSGTSWSVTLAGNPVSSTTGTIRFSEANGTYEYTVGGMTGYTASPSSGSVTVAGAAQSVAITFTALPPGRYTVTFTESGLPSGTAFSVTLGGTTLSSSAPSIVFTETNGTYAYTVGSVTGYTASPASGSVSVAGTAQSVSITFTAVPPAEYPVTFSETGLPKGTSWSVTLAGSTQSSTSSIIWFSKANGTYAFALGNVPGYTPTLTSGSVTVDGAPQGLTITFTAIASTPVSPAAPGWVAWLALIALGVAVVAVVLALGWRRRKGKVSPRSPGRA